MNLDEYLSPAQAARRLGIGRSSLARTRMEGTGPRFARLGARTIRYRVADLDAWAAERAHRSTEAYAPA